MKITRWVFSCAALLLAGLLMLNGCASTSAPVDEAYFVAKVKLTLEYYCIECHNSKSASRFSQLNLETGKLAMTTGLRKPVIVPGDPDKSLLYVVLHLGHEEALGMPPTPDKISDEEADAVRRWIKGGAPWPAGPEGHLHLPR